MRSHRAIWALAVTACMGAILTVLAAPASAQKPTNVCYINHMSDAAGKHEAWIGNQHLAYGHTACFKYSDSTAKETKFYRNNAKDSTFATFTAHNPLIGTPWVGITPDGEETVHIIKLAENMTETYVNTRFKKSYTVHRNADATNAKEFTVDIKIHQ